MREVGARVRRGGLAEPMELQRSERDTPATTLGDMVPSETLRTLAEELDALAACHPQRLALVLGGDHSARAVSFQELQQLGRHLSTALRARGLTAGDCVAMWLSASVAWVQVRPRASRAQPHTPHPASPPNATRSTLRHFHTLLQLPAPRA